MVCSIRQASRSAVWGSTPAATSWRVKNSVFRRSARLPPGLYRSSAGRSLHPSSGSRLFSRSSLHGIRWAWTSPCAGLHPRSAPSLSFSGVSAQPPGSPRRTHEVSRCPSFTISRPLSFFLFPTFPDKAVLAPAFADVYRNLTDGLGPTPGFDLRFGYMIVYETPRIRFCL